MTMKSKKDKDTKPHAAAKQDGAKPTPLTGPTQVKAGPELDIKPAPSSGGE
jgi:hypothetical protein